MGVRELIERVRQAFSPPVRDEQADEAIKALHDARAAARNAARILAERSPKLARQAERIADDANTLSKKLWSL